MYLHFIRGFLFNLYKNISIDPIEGFVVRLEGNFSYVDYQYSTAKYVRKEHVKSSKFWMNEPVIKNLLEQ